jgi:hypothetical protein
MNRLLPVIVRSLIRGMAMLSVAALGCTALTATVITAFPSSVNFVAGVPSTFQVAVFADDNPAAAPEDFAATIDWGDGSPVTAGTIATDDQQFIVTANHTYSTGGSFTVTVTISDVAPGTGTATATSSATSGVTPPSGSATQTWVSGVGDDANPCSRIAPCQTFAGALGKTAAGGEIYVLDPGGFGTLTIYKSITILAAGPAGVMVSLVNGIVIANGPPPLQDVSAQVKVTQNGFGRNRATGLWAATLTVTNTSGTAIAGPVEVGITNLSTNATMVNFSGLLLGNPYVLVSAGGLAPGASASVPIQFQNPTNGFITYTPVTYAPVAGPAINVTLRGLNLDGVASGTNAISVGGSISRINLHLEKTQIQGFTNGVNIAPGANAAVTISNTRISDCNGGAGILADGTAGAVSVVVINSEVHRCTTGLSLNGGAKFNAENSDFSQNVTGVNLADSASIGTLDSDTIAYCTTGVNIAASGGTVRLTNDTISDNATGLATVPGGNLVSYANNHLNGNAVNGAPTATWAQH